MVSRKSTEGEGSRRAETWVAGGSLMATVKKRLLEEPPCWLTQKWPDVRWAAGSKSTCGCQKVGEQCLEQEIQTVLAEGGS